MGLGYSFECDQMMMSNQNHKGYPNLMQVRRLWKEHASKDVTKEPCVDFSDSWNDAKFHGCF